MPNYAFNRLTMTGPSDEIARFLTKCVRIRSDDESGDAPSLDLDAIVPMPPEILATCEGATDEVRAIARAATGFEDWYEWSCARWGTKWNTSDFEGQTIGDSIYDCSFTTVGNCPTSAMRALAALYPKLHGTVIAGEADNDWSLVGAFRDGSLVAVVRPFDPRMEALAHAGRWRGATILASVSSLIAIAADDGLFIGPATEDELWLRTILVIDHIGCDLPERFVFKYVVDQVCDLFEDGGKADVLFSVLAHRPESIRHIQFLLQHDRVRTEIDREMLTTLAAGLLLEATLVANGVDRSNFDGGFWLEQLRLPDGDELRDWACLAMYRPGAVFDFSDDDTLREGLLDYAAQLRLELLAHLRKTGHVRCLPAAA